MKNLLCNGLIVVAGLVSLPGPASRNPHPVPVADADPRLDLLESYLEKMDAPAASLAPVFISVADRYDLDWRLLPSLSVVESTAGKAARNNNMFGWDSGRAAFPTLTAGIETVAYHLANSELYKDKDLNTLLATYNPHEGYPARVKSVMRRIAPSETAEE